MLSHCMVMVPITQTWMCIITPLFTPFPPDTQIHVYKRDDVSEVYFITCHPYFVVKKTEFPPCLYILWKKKSDHSSTRCSTLSPNVHCTKRVRFKVLQKWDNLSPCDMISQDWVDVGSEETVSLQNWIGIWTGINILVFFFKFFRTENLNKNAMFLFHCKHFCFVAS